MPNHEPGNKIQAEKQRTTGDILQSAPIVQGPTSNEKDQWRSRYTDSARGEVFSRVNQQKAEAGYGFYGDAFSNGLFTPPVEFAGGYGSNNALYSPADPFSNPSRYQLGGFNNGYQSKEGWTYGRGGFTNIDHVRIAQCLLLYKTEGVVQTIVHLLADFVVENVDIIHPDVTVHNFYQAWTTKVDLKNRLHRFVVDLLTTGNVFIWTQLAKLKSKESRDMKRGVAAELIGNELIVEVKDADGKRLRHKTIDVETEDGVIGKLKELQKACREQATAGRVNEVMLKRVEGDSRNEPADPQAEPPIKATEIPWNYISLNPLQMEPRGSRFANEHYWVMLIHQRDMRPLSKFMTYRYYSDISVTKVNLPEIFKGRLQPMQRKGTPYAAELRLDENRLSVIHDITKTDYEDWATPQIYPACKEVQFKRMLRQGEISAMESLKHMITLIKLGRVEEGYIPTPEQIERVAGALAGGSQTHHLVWDDLIEGQVLQPNVGNIFDPKKYEQIDKDIYSSLGVAESVFSGNASYANSFMSIKLLLEKLETIREKLSSWLRVEIKKIADSMKFKRLPIIQWGLMNLRDENAERKLWLDLYDRGIVSDQSILERFGTDFEIEAERQRLEKVVKEEENPDIAKPDSKFRAPVMVSRGPFNRDIVQKQTPKPKPPAGKGRTGRPVKTGKPQSTKRSTKPKGMGSIVKFQQLYTFAQEAVKTIHDVATNLTLESNGLRDSRSLTKGQKQDLETLIVHTLAAAKLDTQLTPDLVYNLIRDANNLEAAAQLAPSFNQIVELFQAEASEASTKEERFNLMCSIFAAVHADLLEQEDEDEGIPDEGSGLSQEGDEVSG